MAKYITDVSIFTGDEWLHHQHLVIENGKVAGWQKEKPAVHGECEDGAGKMLVPAFVDLQVYGGGGKLFSQYPSSESLQALADQNRLGGTATCLVTIATQPMDVILKCLDALHDYLNDGGKGIAGLHLEGPFINAEKRGAHVREWIHEPGTEEIAKLLERACGNLKMITVAPECCSNDVLQMLDNAGVIISAGHSNADYETAMQFLQRGIRTVTHLFNAMSALHHRHPGLPMAAMNDAALMASIIPDGIHVDYQMVKLAKQMMADRLYYITDAVTPTDAGPYQHVLAGTHYALPDGTLSGSAISMMDAVRNGIQYCGFSPAESLRMASAYPARLMGWQQAYGIINESLNTPMLLINHQWEMEDRFGF